jgi:hypothetical protein
MPAPCVSPGLGTDMHPFLEMAKVEPIVAEVGELLTVLTVKLESAPVAEIPSLIGEAKQQARRLLECYLASDPIRHLSPGEVAMLRTEFVRLGEALQANIAGIIRLRQLTGGRTTRH